MDTLLYSIAGLMALIAVSFFFTYVGIRRNRKVASRIASVYKAAQSVPERLLFTAHDPVINLSPVTNSTRIRKTYRVQPPDRTIR